METSTNNSFLKSENPFIFNIDDIVISFPFAEFINVFAITKFFAIAFMIVYLIVSWLIIKQIYMMTRTIKGPANKLIILIGYLHFFVAFTIFVVIALIR